ncbi:hypothetical protein ACQJBY_021554 [Aegilops geniculata]
MWAAGPLFFFLLSFLPAPFHFLFSSRRRAAEQREPAAGRAGQRASGEPAAGRVAGEAGRRGSRQAGRTTRMRSRRPAGRLGGGAAGHGRGRPGRRGTGGRAQPATASRRGPRGEGRAQTAGPPAGSSRSRRPANPGCGRGDPGPAQHRRSWRAAEMASRLDGDAAQAAIARRRVGAAAEHEWGGAGAGRAAWEADQRRGPGAEMQRRSRRGQRSAELEPAWASGTAHAMPGRGGGVVCSGGGEQWRRRARPRGCREAGSRSGRGAGLCDGGRRGGECSCGVRVVEQRTERMTRRRGRRRPHQGSFCRGRGEAVYGRAEQPAGAVRRWSCWLEQARGGRPARAPTGRPFVRLNRAS